MSTDDDIEIRSRRDGEEVTSRISEPGKLLRIGHMLRALQHEAAADDVDAPSRERLRHIHQTAVSQLDEQLSGALRTGWRRSRCRSATSPRATRSCGSRAPSSSDGWEGLLQGVQAAVASRHHEAQYQFAQLRQPPPDHPERGTGQSL